MTSRLRKFALTAHITALAGWLGAIACRVSRDSQMVLAAYFSMKLIVWFVIVQFGIATILAGLLESFGTPWGLFRHW